MSDRRHPIIANLIAHTIAIPSTRRDEYWLHYATAGNTTSVIVASATAIIVFAITTAVAISIVIAIVIAIAIQARSVPWVSASDPQCGPSSLPS